MINEGKYNTVLAFFLVLTFITIIPIQNYVDFWNKVVNWDFVQILVGGAAIYLAGRFANKQIKSSNNNNRNTIMIDFSFRMVERYDRFVTEYQEMINDMQVKSPNPHLPETVSFINRLQGKLTEAQGMVEKYLQEIDIILTHLDEDYETQIKPLFPKGNTHTQTL